MAEPRDGGDPGGVDDGPAELFARAASDEAAREELVKMYYPLAESLARRFAGRGEPFDDLLQVASIALLKAIERFEPERGFKFTTYATPTIVGELKRHFRDKGWVVRVPRRLQETALAVRDVVAEAFQDLGRSPTVEEVCERSGLSTDEVLQAMEAVHSYTVDSLDVETEDGTPAVGERVAVEEERFEMLEGWASVADKLRALPERERRVLYMRFGRQMTQSEIAQRLGISQMHVSRLLARTLAGLREAVDPGA